MVGALGSTALAPPKGDPPLTFLSIDGECSRIYSSGTSQETRRRCFLVLMVGAPRRQHPPGVPPSKFLSVDGERSRIYSSSTSQGARCQRFLALMVGAPGSIAPAPPRGAVVDIF
jgi:hypothetical protein